MFCNRRTLLRKKYFWLFFNSSQAKKDDEHNKFKIRPAVASALTFKVGLLVKIFDGVARIRKQSVFQEVYYFQGNKTTKADLPLIYMLKGAFLKLFSHEKGNSQPYTDSFKTLSGVCETCGFINYIKLV